MVHRIPSGVRTPGAQPEPRPWSGPGAIHRRNIVKDLSEVPVWVKDKPNDPVAMQLRNPTRKLSKRTGLGWKLVADAVKRPVGPFRQEFLTTGGTSGHQLSLKVLK